MNSENTFYVINSRGVYTDLDIEKSRDECLRSMLSTNQINQRTVSTIKPPADLVTKLDDLIQRKMTDKGFSNCWALSGDFFDQQSFHGWIITFNPEIPMHDKLERKVQLFGGIGREEWDVKRRKSEFLAQMFGHIAFDNQTVWTSENNVPAELLDQSRQFTIERSQFQTNYDITFAYQGQSSMADTPLQEAERLLHLSFLRPILDLAGFVKDGPQERKWFPKPSHPLHKVSTINEFSNEVALDVIAGYRITIHLKTEDMDNGEKRVFPILKISTQSRLDLHDNCLSMLNRGFEKCKLNQKDFRSKADERDRFIGRSAYLLYGGRKTFNINEIDWNSNEKTVITGQNVTVGDYLKKMYSDDVKEVFESPCTFKRRVGSDEYFLPQFIKMTAKSSDAPMNYGKALELMSKAPFERMRENQNVCKSIYNKSSAE